MNKDTVVGILGAVILVAAMVAIFYYEGTQAPGGTGGGVGGTGGTGTFNSTTVDGPTAQGAAAETPAAKSLNITQTNLTKAEFTVTWTNPQTGNQPFTVKVTSPSGTSLSDTKDSGTATVVFSPLNTPASGTATNGTGTWTVEVTPGASANPACTAAGPLPLPGNPCAAPAWNLATKLTYYRAS